jgi:DNA-directed RNA polymerase specialized sigma24 family protein
LVLANTHTDAHERRLLERARAGEEAAFEDLVRPLARPLKATALSRFRDRQVVDDAFQEAALSAWKRKVWNSPSGAAGISGFWTYPNPLLPALR